MPDLVIHQPQLVLRHAATNAANLLPNFVAGLRPPETVRRENAVLCLIPILLLGMVSIGGILRPRVLPTPVVPPPLLRREALTLLACAALLVLPVCILIYPRPHYLTSLSMMALFAVATLQARDSPSAWPLAGAAALAALSCLLMPSYAEDSAATPRDRINLVRALNAHPDWHDVRMLDPYAVLAFYAPGIGKAFDTTSLSAPFDRYLADNRIDVVALTPILRDHPVLAADPSWQVFLRQPAALGFSCQPVKGSDAQLCISRRLMAAELQE